MFRTASSSTCCLGSECLDSPCALLRGQSWGNHESQGSNLDSLRLLFEGEEWNPPAEVKDWAEPKDVIVSFELTD